MSGMQAYLDSRQRAGLLALPGPVDLVARTTVELCVLWGALVLSLLWRGVALSLLAVVSGSLLVKRET